MCYFLYDVYNLLYVLKFLENIAFSFCRSCITLYLCVALSKLVRSLISYFFGLRSNKLSHQYNTHANQLKKMDRLEQENRELRKELTTLRDSYERLTAMMETLVATQNQSPPPQTPLQRTVISKIVSMPISVAQVSAPQDHMPLGFPWVITPHFVPEGYQSAVVVTMAQRVMSVSPPMVHAAHYVEEHVFHAEQSETLGVYERMDEFQDQFQAMQKEIQALRGK